MREPASTCIINASDGEPLALGLTRKVGGERFGGRVSLCEGVLAPGAFVPPHSHTHEDECTHVLSGELRFVVGDEYVVATAGSYVVKPRGVPHSFWNAGAVEARVIEVVSPGNLDEYFPALSHIFLDERLTDEQRSAAHSALEARYGIHTDRALARSLVERFGIAPRVPTRPAVTA